MQVKHNWSQDDMVVLLKSQGLPPYTHLANLPKNGLVAYMGDTPVAAGFLRLVEGDSAILDSLITNATLEPMIRDKALNLLVSDLLKMAKSLGITKIIAFSSDKNTLVRAWRFGFTQQEYHVITLPLS